MVVKRSWRVYRVDLRMNSLVFEAVPKMGLFRDRSALCAGDRKTEHWQAMSHNLAGCVNVFKDMHLQLDMCTARQRTLYAILLQRTTANKLRARTNAF